MQYLFTCEVSRYCILHFHGRMMMVNFRVWKDGLHFTTFVIFIIMNDQYRSLASDVLIYWRFIALFCELALDNCKFLSQSDDKYRGRAVFNNVKYADLSQAQFYHKESTIRACYCFQPNKRETLSYCWLSAGPTSTSLAQHWTNDGSIAENDLRFLNNVCISPTLVEHSATVKLMFDECPALWFLQNQKAVSAYFTSKQILPFGFSWQICGICLPVGTGHPKQVCLQLVNIWMQGIKVPPRLTYY